MLKYIEYIQLKYYNIRIKLLKYIISRKIKYLGKNFHPDLDILYLGLENISIGDNFCCGKRLKLRTFSEWQGTKYSPHINIGNNVKIESDCQISSIDNIIIEDNVLIASFVFISDINHGSNSISDIETPPINRKLTSRGGIKICKNVWIGEKVSILGGVTIGENSIIGAGAVVTKDIPPYSIAIGIPAKVIKNIKV